jgi:tetraacyldisaccharide 4'-kinase
VQEFLRAQWSKRGFWAWIFLPLSLLVCLFAGLKRMAYRWGLFKATRVSAPVIVIGNLSIGGAGKTPLVAHIAQLLVNQGFRPGIISRGYRGSASQWPQNVSASSDPLEVGDEPVMLATQTGCPVIAGPNRADSAHRLIDPLGCDVLLSDDGFQHLKLARDIDILVFDTAYGDGLGNRWCLPSGPLREPAGARKVADMQVFHGGVAKPVGAGVYTMTLLPGKIYALKDKQIADIELLKQQPLHAVAGIGRPARFFDSARDAGLTIIDHPFDDHHAYSPVDLEFNDEHDVITTEKDAIKLARIHSGKTIWVLPVQARMDNRFDADLLKMLRNL